MKRSFRINHAAVAIVALTASSSAIVACSDDASTPTKTTPDGGSSGSSGTSGTSGGPAALSLYERLGGKEGLETFVKTVVETKILTDVDLKTFFFNQTAMPIPAGHPSAKQITVCFARFVGTALGKDSYPGATVNDPMNTNNPDHKCRSMADSHKVGSTQLNIGSANFDKFIGHIATSLMPLVKPTATKAGEITQAEFDALASALIGQKADVTTKDAPSGGPFVPVLYDRLGGKAGLEAFVKDVVEKHILTDADLKTYFFNQVATPIPAGHPSAKQITVCFARLVGAALGADTYPGAAVSDPTNTNTPNHTCRTMTDSHKGASTMLRIGTGTFDKFISYIAMDLQPLVKPTATKAGEITQAEFDALAGALNGTKAEVTTVGVPAGPGPFSSN